MRRTTWMMLGAVSLVSASSGCKSDNVMEEVTAQVITTSGGTLYSAEGGAMLEFPPGALLEDTEVQIRTIRRGDELWHPSVTGALTFDLSPDGLQLQAPVRLELFDVEGQNLALAQVYSNQILVLDDSEHAPDDQHLSGTLQHFSAYGAVQLRDACSGLSCGDTCTVCDPADSSCVEPPGPRACNVRGACVRFRSSAGLMCGAQGDGGIRGDGGAPRADAGPGRDAGSRDGSLGGPDGGAPYPDSGLHPTPDGGGPTSIFESEPNNSIGSANESYAAINTRVEVGGAIDPAGDRDYFLVFVPPGLFATMTAFTYSRRGLPGVCDPGTDTVLSLYDARGNLITSNDDFNGFECSQVDAILASGEYFLEVRHFDGQSGTIPAYFIDIGLYFFAPGGDGGVFPGGDGGVFPGGDGGVFPGGDGGVFPGADGGSARDGGVRDSGPRDGGAPRDGGVFPGGDGGVFPGGDGGVFPGGDGGVFPGGDGGVFPGGDGGVFPGGDGGTAGFVTELEPNQPLVAAQVLGFLSHGTTVVSAAIDPAGDEDYFTVFVAQAPFVDLHAFTFDLAGGCPLGTDTVLSLLDANGNTLASNDDANGTPCSDLHLMLGGGVYTLRVSHFAPGATIPSYGLALEAS